MFLLLKIEMAQIDSLYEILANADKLMMKLPIVKSLIFPQDREILWFDSDPY
jgi:hypothetical protein